jgi:hypothetical protein
MLRISSGSPAAGNEVLVALLRLLTLLLRGPGGLGRVRQLSPLQRRILGRAPG